MKITRALVLVSLLLKISASYGDAADLAKASQNPVGNMISRCRTIRASA